MSGTGQIAEDTLEVVHMIPGAEVYAIAGRNKEKAEDFAKKHGMPLAKTMLQSYVHITPYLCLRPAVSLTCMSCA